MHHAIPRIMPPPKRGAAARGAAMRGPPTAHPGTRADHRYCSRHCPRIALIRAPHEI